MLARDALCRLTARVPRTHKHDFPQLVRFIHRSLTACNTTRIPATGAYSRACALALQARRSYATTTRAKRPAANAKAKPAAKKKATKTTAKKPATRKRPLKKPAKKTAAKKKKPAARKKPAAKKRVKKVVTAEEKEKAQISLLRKKALREPVSYTALTGFNAFVAESIAGPAGKGRESQNTRLTSVTQRWKAHTPADHERYNRIALEKTAARRAEYKAWILTHTPDQIRIANNARALLRRKLASTQKTPPAFTSKLVDDRQAKKSGGSYINYTKVRWASGEFKGIAIGDAGKLIGTEWKALSPSEKKKYDVAPTT